MPSHLRKPPGQPHNRTPDIIARPKDSRFAVLQRAPQLTGDPEYAVCQGNNSVALFFRLEDAQDYARWRNQRK